MSSSQPAATPAAPAAPAGPTGRDRLNPDWPVPNIQNIVATANMDHRVDLHNLAMHARNVTYKATEKKRFHGAVMRIRDPKTTALVFTSGRLVITGAKSVADSHLAARKHARVIQKVQGDISRLTDFKVQNFVASCNVGFTIRLEGLARHHHLFSRYEPEIFPGLVYRMTIPKSVVLIFATGKIVLIGLKSEDQMYEAFTYIYPVILDYRFAPEQ
ncbi:TATA-binding protein [Apodospora peruviana]|uniref:TATA-binding protein n=1 Tax=Apodospora peruviana TaxID=516989 RepID=A0AAE0I820_9PEZI|nr:TATA-binding protein [Apodospora peruviana]